jgi:hypothetical protein
MSIKLMAEIWDHGPERQGDRFVLMALADYANDGGECWPSVEAIARRTCMSQRGARAILRRLEADGWLVTVEGGGRNQCNHYRVKTRNEVPPERGSVFAETRNETTETRNETTLNPERRSPEPSRTVIEPPCNTKGARGDVVELLCQWASPRAAASFIAYRQQRKKPLTLTGAARLAEGLGEIFNAGGNTDDALGLAEECGWLTIKPEWYFNTQRRADQPRGGVAAAFAAVAARSTPREG